MEYEPMDDDVAQPSGNMIPIAIAVLAIVLGTAGLYFGFNANKRLNSIDTSIQESSTSAVETEKAVASFDPRIVALETKISDQLRLINRLRAYISQSEQKLVGELNTNREQIQKIIKQLNEIKASTVRTSPVANETNMQTAERSRNADEPQTRANKGRTYVIASGDTFGKIAARFGVSLQAIIDANPDADPRRLAIGQKIIIPSK